MELLPSLDYIYVGILGLMVNLVVMFITRGVVKLMNVEQETLLEEKDYVDVEATATASK